MRVEGLLENMVSAKQQELARKTADVPVHVLEQLARECPPALDLRCSLRRPGLQLIAEVKRASPSRGLLCSDFDAPRLARAYAAGGAAAISVLTEEGHFGGSLADLRTVRQEIPLPLLRKDFIIDAYQVYESRVHGADAILLIAAILPDSYLAEVMALACSLGMSCLVEVHDVRDLDRALMSGADIIGINNRDLRTFAVDLDTTRRLRPLIPPGRLVVAESGVHTRHDLDRLRDWNVDAALVGEALVTADGPADKMRELLT